MKQLKMPFALAVLLACLVVRGWSVYGQDQPAAGATPPAQPDEVAAGTRFLIRLQDKLNTNDNKAGNQFKARTLEPLAAADGTVVPAGVEVRGHIDKIESAHKTGRARMWLAFDDIESGHGWIPLVAVVRDLPGVHSVKVDYEREGEIEARSSKRHEQAETAAVGAFVGAAPGVAAQSGKDAAMGAAAGAATAFMIVSGLGQEVTLEKDTKLELTLERPLRLARP
jgi:hypothetical protein